MASVLGLLEAREKRVREEIARLREEAERVQAALGEAEVVLQRLVDARETVTEVLAGPPSVVTEPTGSTVAMLARYGDVPANVLVVLAGQPRLDVRVWADWLDLVVDLPLEVFTDAEARRYLAARHISDEQVVEVILRLSGRLPVLLSLLAEARPDTAGEVGDPTGTAVERFLKWETDPARRATALACALPAEVAGRVLPGVLLVVPRRHTVRRGLASSRRYGGGQLAGHRRRGSGDHQNASVKGTESKPLHRGTGDAGSPSGGGPASARVSARTSAIRARSRAGPRKP